jgi:hypothetical protein
MARTTVRYTKKGPRVTTRYKIGNTTISRSSGGGKKTRTTTSVRTRNTTYSRTS